MLKETAKKYYSSKYNLNCAEAVLYAANEAYELNLEKNALKTMAAFGGGMGIEEACGAMTGGLAALGVIFVNDKAHEGDKIKILAKEFIEKFIQRLGTDNCKALKDLHRNDISKCETIVLTSAEVLDEIIKRENLPI